MGVERSADAIESTTNTKSPLSDSHQKTTKVEVPPVNTVVLLKRVPDLVEDLEVDGTGKALDTEHLKLTLNESDDHALEEALLLNEGGGGEVIVVALDGEDVDKMLFTALAKGADRALKITDAGTVEGTRQLADLFAQALGSLSYDLVLTGVQAADDVDGQLAPTVAANLGVPCIEVITGVEAGDGSVTVRKEYAGGVLAEFEMTLPGVLGIQAARQSPRYAPVSRVRQIQESASLEEIVGTEGEESKFSIVVMTPPETGEGAQMLESVEELIAVLDSKGVI